MPQFTPADLLLEDELAEVEGGFDELDGDVSERDCRFDVSESDDDEGDLGGDGGFKASPGILYVHPISNEFFRRRLLNVPRP